MRDLRYCLRSLLQNPGLLAVAVASLALGLGLNLTVFGLFESVFLRGVTAADPSHTFHLWIGGSNRASYPNFRDLRAARLVPQFAAYDMTEFSIGEGDARRKIRGQAVAGDYFEMLGVHAYLGRLFSEEEKAPEQERQVALISYPYWQQRFQGDREVLGRTLRLNGRPFTIVGVLPDGYRSLHGFAAEPPFYVPYSGAIDAAYQDRGGHPLELAVRTAPAQTREQAAAAVRAAVKELGRLYPSDNPGFDQVLVYGISPFDSARRDGAKMALLFFAIVSTLSALILMIACANVAGMLLARAVYRRRELSIRLALGAGRGRLIRLFLMEGAVLAVAGLASAAILFDWGAHAIQAIDFHTEVPFFVGPDLNWRMALYGAVMAAVTAILCTVAPALEASRANVSSGLKNESEAAGRRRWFSLRNGLVTGQVAVSMLLLVISLLFVRSLRDVQGADPGFNVDNQLIADFRLEGPQRSNAGNLALADRLMERLAKAPGVVSVSAAMIVPLSRNIWMTGVRIEGQAGPEAVVQANAVAPRYFATMGIRVLEGREFTAADTTGAPEVAVVNHAFCNQYLAGRNALGRVISMPTEKAGRRRALQIVGVVGDSKHESLGEPATAVMYRPYRQEDLPMPPRIHVRTAGPASAAAGTVAAIVREAVPEAAVEVSTMQHNIAESIYPNRLGAGLLGAMGALGLLLASVGLYGVLAYAVNRRVREIGVRMALGASRGHMLRMVLRDAGVLAGSGVAIGLLLAVACTRPLAAFLSANISVIDPLTLALVAAVLVFTALAAAWMPARRALHIEPLTALRSE